MATYLSSSPPVGMSAESLSGGVTATPGNMPPAIEGFSIVWVEPGHYQITGRVADEYPGGLTVTFDGIPSLEGVTAVTNADGTFSLTVTLRTDGSDTGNVSAVTVDAGGLSSVPVYYWVDPR
jgi:hypothetical protein